MSLSRPLSVPDAVKITNEVIASLDHCFKIGFSRLGADQFTALQTLSSITSGTPIGSKVSDAVEAIQRNEFVEKHFAAIAAARAALQGAQYDALRTEVASALGREVPASKSLTVEPIKPDAGPLGVWTESTRNWLMELALAGFAQLESQTLAPFQATLQQLQGEKRATRLGAILTGFLQELLHSMPVSSMPEIPVYRWADLWTRSMLCALRDPGEPAKSGETVSGTFTPVGVDLRHHGFFAQADVYGLFDDTNSVKTVKLSVATYKVDVIVGSEIWRCFPKHTDPLMRALSQRARLEIEDCTLLPTGELLWDGVVKPGRSMKLLAEAKEHLGTLPSIAPMDRHPMQIAEIVYLENGKFADKNTLDFGNGVSLPIATKRMSAASELKLDDVKKSNVLVGLIRFDGGAWSIQPLVVGQLGKADSEKYTGSGALAARDPKKGDTLQELQAKASKLLRAKK